MGIYRLFFKYRKGGQVEGYFSKEDRTSKKIVIPIGGRCVTLLHRCHASLILTSYYASCGRKNVLLSQLCERKTSGKPAGVASPKLSRMLSQKGAVSPPTAWIN
ncbi:hypothetical protein AVEN_267723-1 [Araneus ventricosus]|uniref:Uncharacterized protein n=1 Tax=Araneus ventricosus TaxID=182803 RepID=A0A4Y2CX01_ARAVE|nr:hypothetical protein AVEN_267723-1 [Araneus ventricosus]